MAVEKIVSTVNIFGIALEAGTWADWFSGVASFLAVLVAVFSYALAGWQRNKEKRDIIHETCSAVDQVTAYYDAALRISNTLGSPLSFESMARIHDHLVTLTEMLKILSVRPEITDGAIFSAITAKRLAEAVTLQIDGDLAAKSRSDWVACHDALARLKSNAGSVRHRSALVREHLGLAASRSARTIAAKYESVATELEAPSRADGVPVHANLAETRF